MSLRKHPTLTWPRPSTQLPLPPLRRILPSGRWTGSRTTQSTLVMARMVKQRRWTLESALFVCGRTGVLRARARLGCGLAMRWCQLLIRRFRRSRLSRPWREPGRGQRPTSSALHPTMPCLPAFRTPQCLNTLAWATRLCASQGPLRTFSSQARSRAGRLRWAHRDSSDLSTSSPWRLATVPLCCCSTSLWTPASCLA